MTSDKIKLIFGNLFETSSDAIVIPVSTAGTINSSIRANISNKLGILFPDNLPEKELGSLEVKPISRNKNGKIVTFYLLLATCVESNQSSYRTIDALSKKIAEFTASNPIVRKIATPLIGTGAGGLDHINVYDVLAINFEKYSSQMATLEIYVNNESIYQVLSVERDKSFGARGVAVESSNDIALLERIKTIYQRHDIFLADAAWDGVDHSNDFFNNNEWKNPGIAYAERIKNIKGGSVIILKSISTSQNINLLTVKGIGVVIKNIGDGKKLEVDWIYKDLQYEIYDVVVHQSPITKISEDNFSKIMGVFQNKLALTEIISAYFNINKSITSNGVKSVLAGLISDSESKEDYLDFESDIDAFSKIIAAKNFTPPLAIALFGKWGTGKSFFMKKLHKKIDYYSELRDENFCNGIVHIHFNAWSYLDANLWASVVSKIFEGLNLYVSKNTKAERVTAEVRNALMEQFSFNKSILEKTKKEQNDIIAMISSLNEGKKKIILDVENKKNAITKDIFSRAIRVVDENLKISVRIGEAFKENSTVISASNELSKIIPTDYLKNPSAVLKKVDSFQTHVKVFFSREKIWSNIVWLLAIVLFAFYVPLLLNWLVKQVLVSDFSIPPLTAISRIATVVFPLFHLIKKTYKEVQPLANTLWKIKIDYETALKDEEANITQKDKELTAAIASSQIQLAEIEKALQQKELLQAQLKYKKENALSTVALHDFIGNRTISQDYQQHLGIVSTIRCDFEVLSDLFYGHNEESKRKEFLDNFEQPLERIILYIDDLDRCQEDRVVEVLEAVNLLMAFPLFVVVVGVDPRWVRNALKKRNSVQFTSKDKSDSIDASDYLEKIFQVPFHLKSATSANVKNMIKTLGQAKATYNLKTAPATLDKTQDKINAIEWSSTTLEIKNTKIDNLNEIETSPTLQEKLKLNEWEVEKMGDMAIVLGDNPRAIKRFVNIYQIVRAHNNIYNVSNEQKEFKAIIFLIAFYNGHYKTLAKSFLEYLSDSKNINKQLISFFHDYKVPDELTLLKNSLKTALESDDLHHEILGIETSTLQMHNAFIRRFTFQDIEVC